MSDKQTAEKKLPDWANEIKRRYLRGEASLFVLHGNVHDVVLYEEKMLSLTSFLTDVLLKDNKETIGVFNVATGFQIVQQKSIEDFFSVSALGADSNKAQWLDAIEKLLITKTKNGVIVEYAESIAPAGEPSFQSDLDRAAIIMLHRWSFLPSIAEQDNVVILLTENLTELSPKLVSNPRIAVIEIPLPDSEQRERSVNLTDPQMTDADAKRYAEMTAGLKLLQITSILKPFKTAEEDLKERQAFIAGLLGGGENTAQRAHELAALTSGKNHDEIRKLLAPDSPDVSLSLAEINEKARQETDKLIAQRKREIIERECFGLLEFIEPNFGFEVVGGIEAVKEDLGFIAKSMREGKYARVPMGVLFTGPQGTGKTFLASAFAGECGMTAVKLKNFRSKWVGATEGNLERILSVIKAIGQVIVIVDEGDRAFGNADGEGDDGTSSRVIAKLKEFMSDTSNRGRVLFIVMTNRPDKLDIDLKRAGRLDRKIPLFYPQTTEEVLGIAKAVTKKNKLAFEETAFNEIAVWERLVGYSAADIEAVLLQANENAARDSDEEHTTVTPEHLSNAANDYFPTRDTAMLRFMELLSVFECSNRRLLPERYANMSADELDQQLHSLRLLVGERR
jgi:SpoVK/Ycf46/Vps4 family AAA+-type ATPase